MIDAIAFAADKHRNQQRKDLNQTPYIIHPIEVADQLLVIGQVRDSDIIIAALLHDTIEDTNTSYQEITQKFGRRVADFVQEVTDDKSLPKEERKRLQIVDAPHKSAGAAQIKLSDKLCNLKDLIRSPPVGWPMERIKAYFEWAEQVIDRLPWVNAALKQAVDDAISAYKRKADEP
ncbi:HD domain-containing protein [Candidatus Protochlamydia phocaeensis]|uniref:HD domain-containing protein n=1 Tax=Candidatus Protochlamydia phocaeensis TaxID=1414722 RepID=UPI0008399C0B